MTGIVSYFHDEKEPVNEIIFVPTTIMSRIFRTHDAIGVLLKNNHPSEAALLTLPQFELRLDIAHTASDIKHSTAWLDHEDKKWSLLAVKSKIDTLFSEGAERNLSTTLRHRRFLFTDSFLLLWKWRVG